MAPKAKRPQAKKKATAPAPKKSNLASFIDRLPKNEIEYLEMLARKDQEQIKGDGSSLDDLFTKQRDRNLAKAAALKAAK